MRKHRSLGEMISTATFLGCGVFIFIYSMELLELGQHHAPILGLPRLYFVFWVDFASP